MPILSKEQAVACAYALDTSELCAHLTIGADIDVQKLPGGQVTVEARGDAEYFHTVGAFIASYAVPVSAHPLADLRRDWKEQEDAERVGRIVMRVMVVVAVLAVLFGVGVVCSL